MRALRKFSKHKPLAITAVYGGVSITPQIDELRRADVVVGTPGRILDHLERRTINFSRLKILVLDEADRMFDMGFIDDVKRIIKTCPQNRQTMLFSSTIPSEIEEIVQRIETVLASSGTPTAPEAPAAVVPEPEPTGPQPFTPPPAA